MLFLFRSAPKVEKRIHSKFFRKFWEEPGYKRTDLHYCTSKCIKIQLNPYQLKRIAGAHLVWCMMTYDIVSDDHCDVTKDIWKSEDSQWRGDSQVYWMQQIIQSSFSYEDSLADTGWREVTQMYSVGKSLSEERIWENICWPTLERRLTSVQNAWNHSVRLEIWGLICSFTVERRTSVHKATRHSV